MKPTLIIAEAGVNHNGSIELAKKLIDCAAEAGADYVKFQTFKTGNLVCKSAEKAEYQKQNMKKPGSQYEMLKALELTPEMHYVLKDYASTKQIKFLSAPFDLESIHFLSELKLGLWKIPSGENTNYPYLKEIARKNELVILSTGMSNLKEIEDAVNVLTKYGTDRNKITILHCNTEYPTPMQDVNLKAMVSMAEYFKMNTGYSDHTEGIEVPIAAVALGASVIEKHFTLDKSMDGPDHKASLNPEELKSMVKAIRNIEKALGEKDKKVSNSELKNKQVARKSIVASRFIEKGEMLTEENLTTKRPGTGISPMEWEKIIGTKAIKDFLPDDLIELKYE